MIFRPSNGNLLVISHTPHYQCVGEIVGWGATIREIDYLATLFKTVVHIAPLHADVAPASSLAYQSPRVRVRSVPPVGGEQFRDKLKILLRYPGYVRTILEEMHHADAIHVRSPANISLLALLLLAIVPRPQVRWVKYAGEWNRTGSEPWSYRLQRWFLAKNLHRGVVTVNGSWPNQPKHMHSFLNPCLTDEELCEAQNAARGKMLANPVKLLFVGSVEESKGLRRVLHVLHQLHRAGVCAELDVIGEGSDREACEVLARGLGLFDQIQFHGGLPRPQVGKYYSTAHFILLPSESEGWPKVLSEAMAYGVVPVASRVGSIPQILESFGVGKALDLANTECFFKTVLYYCQQPNVWMAESKKAASTASAFSYSSYVEAVRELLSSPTLGSV